MVLAEGNNIIRGLRGRVIRLSPIEKHTTQEAMEEKYTYRKPDMRTMRFAAILKVGAGGQDTDYAVEVFNAMLDKKPVIFTEQWQLDAMNDAVRFDAICFTADKRFEAGENGILLPVLFDTLRFLDCGYGSIPTLRELCTFLVDYPVVLWELPAY